MIFRAAEASSHRASTPCGGRCSARPAAAARQATAWPASASHTPCGSLATSSYGSRCRSGNRNSAPAKHHASQQGSRLVAGSSGGCGCAAAHSRPGAAAVCGPAVAGPQHQGALGILARNHRRWVQRGGSRSRGAGGSSCVEASAAVVAACPAARLAVPARGAAPAPPAAAPGYEPCQGSYSKGSCDRPPPDVTCTPDLLLNPKAMARLAGQAWKVANAVGFACGWPGVWSGRSAHQHERRRLLGSCPALPTPPCTASWSAARGPHARRTAGPTLPCRQGYQPYDIRRSTLMSRANGMEQRAKVCGCMDRWTDRYGWRWPR